MQYNGINEGTTMMVNNIEEQEFFLAHLTKEMTVLEYGCGESTMTIAPLVKHLVCIEHKEAWATEIMSRVNAAGYTNVQMIVKKENHEPSANYDDGTYEDFKDYVEAIHQFAPETFDIVFIDGRARVDCAKGCVPYVKKSGCIFIHDYRHPTEEYRRREYEVVEDFLELEGHVFALGKLVPKYWMKTIAKFTLQDMQVDQDVCWYKNEVIEEMNRFYDLHLKNQDIIKHFKPFTDLLEQIINNGDLTLLDIGCGTAMLSEFCKNYAYYGADLPHVVAGCALRNYPQYFYRGCEVYNEDIWWIGEFDIVVINGLLDVMQYPLFVLKKLLNALAWGGYLIIHRQEVTELGPTRILKNGSYGSTTYHSIIAREDLQNVIKEYDCVIIKETQCGFTNWENTGNSFLIYKDANLNT